MPVSKLTLWLDSNGVRYTRITHSVAFTAQEIASLTHISGDELAKSVMVFADDQLVMAVVPASRQVSLAHLKDATGATTITLANESEFRGAFPDCELGAMPPFGHLYNIPVYVDESLRGLDIVFNACSHHELIRLTWNDYILLAEPIVASISVDVHELAAAR